jgi:hypothetical protein
VVPELGDPTIREIVIGNYRLIYEVVSLAATKAERRALRAQVAEYHEREQRALIERLRQGLADLDAGTIDAFDFDETVHQYHRASQKLWSFLLRGREPRGARFTTERHVVASIRRCDR